MRILHAGCTATGTPFNGFQQALHNVCTDYREINNGSVHKDSELLRVNNEVKPDIIFFQYQTDNVINPATFSQLKQSNPDAWIVNYTGDVRHPLPQHYVSTGKVIDCTLFCNYTDVHEARRLGINAEYLQYGIDPKIYYSDGSETRTTDVVFFGNNYVNQFPLSIQRQQMVDFLKKQYGTRFKVYGNNWQNPDGNVNHSQQLEANIYRGAKIGINLSHFDYERYSSDRMFRLMGSGALCLTHRYAGLHLDFDSGENVVAWDSLEHLKSQIDYYLENEDERNRISANGAKLIHEKFTFEAMIKNLLNLYEHRNR